MGNWRSLFTWRKLPGHALWVLGLGWKGLDILGHFDMAQRVVEAMGGTPAMIASVLSSTWTSVALVVAGIGYIVLVGEPEKGVQRHHWWPYVGWAIFAFSVASMVSVVIYGANELFIRKEIAKGIVGIPRNTPDENNPNRPQIPLETGDRSIQPDQFRILMVEFNKIRDSLPILNVCTTESDQESLVLRQQFFVLLNRSGVVWSQCGLVPSGPDDVGFIIYVASLEKIPPAAEQFREALEIANMHPQIKEIGNQNKIMQLENMIRNAASGFVFYIAPKPIRWR